MTDQPRRGRPVAVVPADVARVALELFERQGFDDTSMDQVAAAAGLSRRSLFNHFPAKADLVWFGLEPFVHAFRSLLDSAGAEQTLMATIERCQLEAVLALDEELPSIRARTRIIAEHPELSSYASTGLTAINGALQDLVVRRLGLAPGHVAPFVLADTITAQMFSAFRYWAVSTDDLSPADTLHAASLALQAVVATPLDPVPTT